MNNSAAQEAPPCHQEQTKQADAKVICPMVCCQATLPAMMVPLPPMTIAVFDNDLVLPHKGMNLVPPLGPPRI